MTAVEEWTPQPGDCAPDLRPCRLCGHDLVREVLDRVDERDRWLRRVLASWREGHALGYKAGYRAGLAEPREPLDVDEPGAWPVQQLGPLPAVDPELDRRRYPPNGRKRFGEPRPGDFPGRGNGEAVSTETSFAPAAAARSTGRRVA